MTMANGHRRRGRGIRAGDYVQMRAEHAYALTYGLGETVGRVDFVTTSPPLGSVCLVWEGDDHQSVYQPAVLKRIAVSPTRKAQIDRSVEMVWATMRARRDRS